MLYKRPVGKAFPARCYAKIQKAERVGLQTGEENYSRRRALSQLHLHRLAFSLFHRQHSGSRWCDVNDNTRYHTGTQALTCTHGQQGCRFHFIVHYAHRLPLFHRTFKVTNYATRVSIVTFLTWVEGIRRSCHANVSCRANGFRSSHQRSRTFEISDSREFQRCEAQARAIQTDRRRGNQEDHPH